MSQRLRDLIRQVRECKTSAEEREVISKEAALIRTAFSRGSEYRPRNIAKLLFMNMLGYPTHWGQMECVKSIAATTFTDKRIGYLGLNVLLDENQEVLMLATHSMKTDLLFPNQFIAGLALTTLGNIASEQICRDCAPEIENLLSNPNPYIQKKATLCAVKIIRKTPDLADQFKIKIKDLLNEKDHAVLIATITLMTELCRINDSYKEFFRQKLLIPVIKILKSLATAGYAPEYDVGTITDPFLQVRILNLLRIIGTGDSTASEKMNEVLAQIATNTDSGRNVGISILYECVNTIMSIECDTELRVMAINSLAKFLQNKDNNIRYVALFTLCKVVDKDTEAVKRHRNMIMTCLRDTDATIKRRALQLVYALVDSVSVRSLVQDLLDILLVDTDFRAELTVKLCYVAEKFAPSTKWLIDTMLCVLPISGDHIPEDVRSNFTNRITREEALHPYLVHKVYTALSKEITQQALNQIGVWCIGEYGDYLLTKMPEEGGVEVTPEQIVSLLQKILNSVSSTTLTKKYVLTALLKLSVRLGPSVTSQIRNITSVYERSMDLELQQRACEYSHFWNFDLGKRQEILARLPPLQVSTDTIDIPPILPIPQTKAETLIPTEITTTNNLELFKIPITIPTAPVTNPTSQILSLFETNPITTPAPVFPLVTPGFPPPANGSFFPGPIPMVPTPIPPPSTVDSLNIFGGTDSYPPMVAFQNGEITLTFNFKKPNPQALQYTLITATYTNTCNYHISDIVFQAAPPRHVKYVLEFPSSTMVEPGGTITQIIKASNSMQGQKPLMMKMRLAYTINQQKREIEHLCKEFPPGI